VQDQCGDYSFGIAFAYYFSNIDQMKNYRRTSHEVDLFNFSDDSNFGLDHICWGFLRLTISTLSLLASETRRYSSED